MTQEEALQVLAILKAAYPHSYNGMSKKEAMGTASVWSIQLSDVSADIVLMAVNKAISTSKFPPSIAEVKEKIGSIYWEAHDMLFIANKANALPEEKLRFYQRIYDETKNYKMPKMEEPSISKLIQSGMKVKLLE